MPGLPSIGAELRRGMDAKGLDLEALARESGLSETRTALALAGSGKTTTHDLVRIALMLGVKLEFSFKKEEPPVTPKGFSSSRSISRSWHGGSVCSISRTRALRWEQSFSDTGEGGGPPKRPISVGHRRRRCILQIGIALKRINHPLRLRLGGRRGLGVTIAALDAESRRTQQAGAKERSE